MISKEEVKKIANLARLDLTNNEIVKMQKDMSVILDYFDLLKKAPKPKKGGSPSSGTSSAGNSALREDIEKSQKREVVEKLVAAAPDKKDDYIKVKTVF